MFENSIYSVISPEGCAAILWKASSARDKAADALRLTAVDLARLGVIDEVLPEPLGGAHEDWDSAAAVLREAVVRHLVDLVGLEPDELRTQRLVKFQCMGQWLEAGQAREPEPA
jgi:acetyl-CoA carboxylase carboxyl transferase subunit alpha